jgi:hypothetical protein
MALVKYHGCPASSATSRKFFYTEDYLNHLNSEHKGWKKGAITRKNLDALSGNDGVTLALPEESLRDAPECIFDQLHLENGDILAWLRKTPL